jgi:hypothetical protein
MKQYFDPVLSKTDSESEWEFRLAYAAALEKVGEPKAAAAQYEKLFTILDRQSKLRESGVESLIDASYESFVAHHPKFALSGVHFGKGYIPGTGLVVGEKALRFEIPGQLLTIIDMRQDR